MTNEEHIEQLKKLRSFHNGSYGRSINKAIEALEQEPILDKIRAEIEQIYTYEHIMFKKRLNSTFACVCIDDVLQIIDKYKAESEDE